MKRYILLTEEDIRKFTKKESEIKQEIEALLEEAFPEHIPVQRSDEPFDIDRYT